MSDLFLSNILIIKGYLTSKRLKTTTTGATTNTKAFSKYIQ